MLDLVLLLFVLLQGQPPVAPPESAKVSVRSVQSDQPVDGSWVELSASTLSVQTENSLQSLSVSDLQTIEFPKETQTSGDEVRSTVLLHDGSRLHPTSIASQGKDIRVELGEGVAMDLSPLAIKAIQLQTLSEATLSQWNAIVESRVTGDTLVVIRSPESLDKIEGSIGEINDESIGFSFGGQQLSAPRAKLAGLRFFSPPTTLNPVQTVVTDRWNNVWNATEVVSPAQSNRLDLVLAGGGRVSLPLTAIRLLDFSIGSLVYIAELTPTDFESQASDDLLSRAGANGKLFEPGPIRLPKTSGPSLRFFGSGSMTYRIPADYSKLEGTLCLAPSGDRHTPCTVRVKLENEVIWEQKLESLSQRLELSIPVQAEKRLRFEVAPEGSFPIGDIVIWQELRLLK